MSSMRISGMASGMDTESIIKNLMKVERARVDKFGQNKQSKVWKQEQYNNVNKDLANFVLDLRKELEMTKTSVTGGLAYNSSSNFSWVRKATSSNENIASVTASASAPEGSYTLKVHQLATGISAASSDAVENQTLGELYPGYDWGPDVDGVSTNKYKITINGKELEFSSNAKISDVAKRINKEVEGINASYDSTAKRFFLSTTATGGKAKLNVDANAEDLFGKIGLKMAGASNAADGSAIASGTEYLGNKAIVDFNGATGIEYDTNNFSINGIQIQLKSKTADPVTINVNTDVDGVYNKIKTFVDKYNEIIGKLNKKISEKPNRNYKPLTAEQKQAMKEDEVKRWEEKAQAGMLYNDSSIQNMLANMRLGLYEEVDGAGKYNHLTSVGIETEEYRSKGKLKIDDEKLKKAIADDPEAVMNLFFQEFTPGEGYDALTDKEKAQVERKGTGLINRLFDDIVEGMKEVIDKSGTGDNAELYRSVKSNILLDFVLGKGTGTGSVSYLDKDIIDIEKSIISEESRLVRVENAYWAKFTAMEKALQKMNSQSSWLTQQLASL